MRERNDRDKLMARINDEMSNDSDLQLRANSQTRQLKILKFKEEKHTRKYHILPCVGIECDVLEKVPQTHLTVDHAATQIMAVCEVKGRQRLTLERMRGFLRHKK